MKAVVLREFFEGGFPVHFITPSSPLGMNLDYPEPWSIGADRLANAAGVLGGYGAPAVIIDFGTAVTFDVVSSEPAYCGGVIAPGLGLVAGYLPDHTAQLPAIGAVPAPVGPHRDARIATATRTRCPVRRPPAP